MTKVALITPFGFQNQGVRLLSAMLHRDGFDADVLFMKSWANNDVKLPGENELALFDRFIKESGADLVGFGFGSPYLNFVTELTQRVRKISDAKIIWGGVHPTISPEDCIDHADFVCVGEGEYPLLDLVRAISNNEDGSNILNLWAKKDGKVIQNPLRPLIDLDTLPYDRLFHDHYYTIESGKLVRRDPILDGAMYRVYSSRGCPFHCAFCYNNQYRKIFKGLGKYHRTRSVNGVLHEIEITRSVFPSLHRVRFDDDSFVFPKAWVNDFTKQYPDRIGIPFDVLLQPEAYNETTLHKLKQSGLVHVQAGIQSASESERSNDYDRKGGNDRILQLARFLKSENIEVTYDVILDNPFADQWDKRMMLDFLLLLPRPFNLFLYSLTLFPKSEISNRLLKSGRITENDIEGRATKSFAQFRLSFDYPRSAEETFFAALISLTSKSFIPRPLIRRLGRSKRLMKNPRPLRYLAEIANFIKLSGVALKMFSRGELSVFKVREYGSRRRALIQ